MTREPLVSAVIPAFNAERFIRTAVQSALAQTYASLEVIVVDDGSTDRTGAIAQGFGKQVHYVWQGNQGVAAARNTGIELARGELIAFLDADDEWLPDKTTTQVTALLADGAIAAFTATRYVDEMSGHEWIESCPAQPDVVQALLVSSAIVGPPSAALVRRQALRDVGGFDRQLSQSADWDMWLRLAMIGRFSVTDEPLVRYRVHNTNMSRDARLLEADTLRVFRKFFASADGARYAHLKRRAYSNHYLIFSGSYLHARDLVASARCLAHAVRYRPAALSRAVGLPLRCLARTMRGARTGRIVRGVHH